MQVEFHRKFIKRYAKIPVFIRAKCEERLRLFEQEPFHPLLDNHALKGDRFGQWSINITGDWRALYEFLDSETIIFVEIDTRSNLYK